MALGERIKSYRQNSNMSQEMVAELIGVSRQAVTKWEANQSAPNTENLFKLAEIVIYLSSIVLGVIFERYKKNVNIDKGETE